MHSIRGLAAAAAMAALAIVSLSAQKSSAAKEQKFSVAFAFQDTYTGTMTLTFDGEKVSGRMAIDTPSTVTGTVAGTLKGDTLTLDYPFELSGDQPCTGRVTVNAKFNAARTEAKGTAHAEGCGDEPLDGGFTMTKEEPRAN